MLHLCVCVCVCVSPPVPGTEQGRPLVRPVSGSSRRSFWCSLRGAGVQCCPGERGGCRAPHPAWESQLLLCTPSPPLRPSRLPSPGPCAGFRAMPPAQRVHLRLRIDEAAWARLPSEVAAPSPGSPGTLARALGGVRAVLLPSLDLTSCLLRGMDQHLRAKQTWRWYGPPSSLSCRHPIFTREPLGGSPPQWSLGRASTGCLPTRRLLTDSLPRLFWPESGRGCLWSSGWFGEPAGSLQVLLQLRAMQGPLVPLFLVLGLCSEDRKTIPPDRVLCSLPECNRDPWWFKARSAVQNAT